MTTPPRRTARRGKRPSACSWPTRSGRSRRLPHSRRVRRQRSDPSLSQHFAGRGRGPAGAAPPDRRRGHCLRCERAGGVRSRPAALARRCRGPLSVRILFDGQTCVGSRRSRSVSGPYPLSEPREARTLESLVTSKDMRQSVRCGRPDVPLQCQSLLKEGTGALARWRKGLWVRRLRQSAPVWFSDWRNAVIGFVPITKHHERSALTVRILPGLDCQHAVLEPRRKNLLQTLPFSGDV
jgi:hypothetical protein